VSVARPCIVWDNHACLPLRASPEFMDGLARFTRAVVDVVSINVGFGTQPLDAHLRMLAYFRAWIGARSDKYRLVETIEDIEKSKAAGTLGICFDVEGMVPVIDQPDAVQTLYGLGVRWMLIAYNQANGAGGGCMDVDRGLTAAGRVVIEQMNETGMVLCVSHTGERTALEAIEASRQPVILSHSNPASVDSHVRNVSDTLIRECAASGGVVGISGIGPYLGDATDLVGRWVTQARYVADLVGTAHVGLGLDFVFDRAELDECVRQNPQLFPAGVHGGEGFRMIAPERVPDIASGLSQCGFSDDEVCGILGANWLRVARMAWK
jgi:membrane dipeptidase